MSRSLQIVTRVTCDLCGESPGTPFDATDRHRVDHLARAWGWDIRDDDVCQSCQNASWDEAQA